MKKLSCAIFAIMCLGLAACADKPEPKPPIYVKSCGTLRTFSKAQQIAIAAQLMRAQPNNPVIQVADDWIRMRDEIRACAAR